MFTEKVMLDLIDHSVPILTALIAFIGAVGTVLSLVWSKQNGKDIKETKQAIEGSSDDIRADIKDNTDKTVKLEQTVDGRMTAFIEATRIQNEKILKEAVIAAEQRMRDVFVEQITALRLELSKAQEKLNLKQGKPEDHGTFIQEPEKV